MGATDGKRRPPSPGGAGGAPGGARVVVQAVALVGQLGFTVVGGAAAGMAAGWALDRRLGTRPGLMIAGLVVGLAGGALAAYRLVTGFMKS